MQILAGWLVLGLFLFQSSTPVKKSDREHDGLLGNVRSMLFEIARLSEESGKATEGERFGQTVTRYDANGSRTEVVRFLDRRLIFSRSVYTHDSQGNYVQTTYDAKKPSGKSATGGGPQSPPLPTVLKCKVKDDSSGSRIEEACYDEADKPRIRTVYRYDNKNNRMETIEFDSHGNVRSECSETLGDHNQITERTCSQPTGIASFTKQSFSYEFDSTGNWIKRHSSAWQREKDKLVFIGKDVVYRTISYDAAKDVSPDDSSRIVDSLPDIPMVIRRSGGVLQESATRKVMPSYPREARAAGVDGSVVVEVKVSENGKVEKAEAVSGPAELRDAAVDAVKQWEFRPTLLSGQAVKVIGRITFNFHK